MGSALLRFSAGGAGWASGALVALGCVQDELAEEFAGGSVDDPDVEVLDRTMTQVPVWVRPMPME